MERKDGTGVTLEQAEKEIDELLLRLMPQGTTLDLFSRVSESWLRIYEEASEGVT